MSRLNFTMSWDDGSPYDLRLADLLLKYNLASTFYIPKNNIEGIPVVTSKELTELSKHFEIGAHTIDHVRLNNLSHEEITSQIQQSKEWLEYEIGSPIYGFCYPGGGYNDYCIDAVKKAGFFYSRTVENFSNNIPNLYEMPTTLQIFNHKNYILLSNIIKSKNSFVKFSNYHSVLSSNKLINRLEYILEHSINEGFSYLHFWGHSWEIERYDLWDLLEDFFKLLRDHSHALSFKTNYECALQFSDKTS